jgi:hypothetical protein
MDTSRPMGLDVVREGDQVGIVLANIVRGFPPTRYTYSLAPHRAAELAREVLDLAGPILQVRYMVMPPREDDPKGVGVPKLFGVTPSVVEGGIGLTFRTPEGTVTLGLPPSTAVMFAEKILGFLGEIVGKDYYLFTGRWGS